MAKIIFITKNTGEFAELKVKFQNDGYEVLITNSEKEVLDQVEDEKADILIIDKETKDPNELLLSLGLETKKRSSSPFVIIVSEISEDDVLANSFNLGADDFLIKPIKPLVIAARIRAFIKRKQQARFSPEKQELAIDNEKFIVIVNSKKIDLPRIEFKLLKLLYSNPEKIFTRLEIAKRVWEDIHVAERRTIDAHIKNIRSKIGDNYIKTIHGSGYIFIPQ
ncbi:MAG TPA: response regulator transcription factor [Bacteroidia bacterium]|jgi:two-component system alkaline phosphatase synthesis response regulator PhoP|nr:response regulator transcription factor [Bacteroidia bacterium]